MLQRRDLNERARDTARKVEAEKTGAKKAIRTSKHAWTKAETTCGQAVAMSKKHSARIKGQKERGRSWRPARERHC